jgi:aerobic-type carbon monoxide dehydrogenase small subunit (CoxS/CutS family)
VSAFDDQTEVTFTLNGTLQTRKVNDRKHLADFVREDMGLTGTHLGCEHGVCGACGVLVDGTLVRGCLTFAARLQGASILTIEGASDSGIIDDLKQAFIEHNAGQCGFCTPGMLLAAHELCRQQPEASRGEVREFLSGNFCRCTGYQPIVDAIEDVLQKRRKMR